MRKLERISVRFPILEYNQLKRDAKRQDITIAELLRRALAWYLANGGSFKKMTVRAPR
jgi:hypothetical protein